MRAIVGAMRASMLMLLACLAPAALATPDEAARCALAPAAQWAEQMQTFDGGMLDRAVAQEPSLAEVADALRREQALERELGQLQLARAARLAPDRLVFDAGPAGLMRSAEIAARACCAHDAQIRDLQRRLAAARQAAARHPKRPELDRVLRSQIGSPAWQNALRRLAEAIAPINARLAECRALRERPLQSLTE